jgi:hypothetical protein
VTRCTSESLRSRATNLHLANWGPTIRQAATAADDAARFGSGLNAHGNDLPTCGKYLRVNRKQVTNIRLTSVPYFGVQFLSTMIAKYHRDSTGELATILTPYQATCLWRGNRLDTSKHRSME